jgi:hypothetical protein
VYDTTVQGGSHAVQWYCSYAYTAVQVALLVRHLRFTARMSTLPMYSARRCLKYYRPVLATGTMTGRCVHRKHPSNGGDSVGTMPRPSDDSLYLPLGRPNVDSVETWWGVR